MIYKHFVPMKSFARWELDCDECDDMIYEGDAIGFNEQTGEWNHYECLRKLIAWEVDDD